MRKAQKDTNNTGPMGPENYAKHCQELAGQYVANVLSNNVLVNRDIKAAVKRGIADKKRNDLIFDQGAVNRVFEFFSFTRVKVGRQVQQFPMLPYQAWILTELFGYYYKDDNTRRFMFAMLWVARKNGKTVFAEIIAMYMFIYDEEINAEVYFAATGPEQTRQLWDYAKSIVEFSPALKKRIRQYQYHMTNAVNGKSIMKYVISNANKLDSLGPHFALVDEYHAHKDDSLFTIMVTGMANRTNPMIMITSTAGVDKEGPFYKAVELGRKVLKGEAKNDRYFYALYSLDDESEIEKPEMWIKANPSMGATITEKRLRDMYDAAKLTPTELHHFKIKNLNVFQDELIDQWISDEVYKKCFKDNELERLANWRDPKTGQRVKIPIYLGIDASSTRDLASIGGVVEHPETKKIHAISEFFFPNNPKKVIRGTAIDLRDWIKKGWITEMESEVIDQDFILERIIWFNEHFEIKRFVYDQWNIGNLLTKIKLQGISCKPAPQTAMFFNFPLKTLERWIYTDQIVMSRNPVLRWNFSNIVLYVDGNGNIKIMKNKSKDSVDGAIALAQAIAGYIDINNLSGLFEMYKKTG